MTNGKILIPVLHYYPVIGGLETWTQNTAERLSKESEIFIVTGKVENQPRRETKNGVNIFRTSLFVLKDLSYSSPFYILSTLPFIFLKSFSLIKKKKINLCHCQGFLSGFLGYCFSVLTKTPYIVTIQREERSKGFLRKLVYRNAKICLAPSSAVKGYFEDIGCKDIEVIPNGIDLERFKNLDRQRNREKLGLKDEFVIMTVARLEKVKGIEYLIEAVKIFQPSITNFKLIIIGDGTERNNLANLVHNLNLKDKIKFLGPIPNLKIPGYLIAADCSVVPSLKEGFGIVILEAMAAGLPVIGTKVGGIPDIIKNGENGILIEPKNPEAIAKAILNLFSNSEFAKKLVQNAKTDLKKYDWNNIAQRVNLISQRVIIKK